MLITAKRLIFLFAQTCDIWCKFLISTIRARKASQIVLFHVENWQIFSDIGSRRNLTYYEIIGRDRTIFLDFTSNLMVRCARLFFGASSQLADCPAPDLIKRNLWDIYLRNLPKKACHLSKFSFTKQGYSDAYERISDALFKENRTLLRGVSSLIALSRVEGVAVVQDCYFDQCIKIVTRNCGKRIYLPESKYGFYYGPYLDLHREVQLHRRQEEELDNRLISRAEKSLLSRAQGLYSQSSINFYMSDILAPEKVESVHNDKRILIILFMHCFTDAPNCDLYDLSQFLYADHFQFFLDFFGVFDGDEKYQVLVKPHPARLNYAGDYIFNSHVEGLVNNSSNFEMISGSAPLDTIISKCGSRFYALTGFGSVTLECSRLGIPVLNYKKNTYTELGLAVYCGSALDVKALTSTRSWDDSLCDPSVALKVEAVRILSQSKAIFQGADHGRKKSNILPLVTVTVDQ